MTWCAVWKGSGRACLGEKHGGSTLEVTTNVARFFLPWTVTRDVWLAALHPEVSGVAVDALLFHEAGRRLVHTYCVYKDPFPHPALRGDVVPRLLSCVIRAMVIARLTHLRISIPSTGAPPGQVPPECFPGSTAPVQLSRRRRVSFADDVTMLEAEESPHDSSLMSPLILPVVKEEVVVGVPETGLPSLNVPVMEDIDIVTLPVDLVPIKTTQTESVLPPPPGFLPFIFPENDGGMNVEDLCTRLSKDSSLTLSPFSRVSSDIPNTPEAPTGDVGCPPLKDNSSEELPALGYAGLPLPSVDNSVKFRCLGGRFSQKGRRSLSVLWVQVVPSETPRTVCQTMRNQ